MLPSHRFSVTDSYKPYLIFGLFLLSAFFYLGNKVWADDSDCKFGGPPDPNTGEDTCVQNVVCTSYVANCEKFVFMSFDGNEIKFCACVIDTVTP